MKKRNKRHKEIVKLKAVSGCKPYSVEEIRLLNVQTIEQLNDNISGIFPVVLSLTCNDGMSIRAIEEHLYIKSRLINNLLNRHRVLAEYVRKARTLKTDVNVIKTLQ